MNESLVFIEELIEGEKNNHFWSKYNKFCEDLFMLNLDINRFVLFIPYLFKELGNDMSSSKIYTSIEKYCSHNNEKGNELYEALFNSKDISSINLIPSAIRGLSENGKIMENINKVKELLESENILLKKTGVLSVLNIQITSEKEKNTFLRYASKQFQLMLDLKLVELYPAITKVCKSMRSEIANADDNLIRLSKEKTIEVQIELIYALDNHIDVVKDNKLFKSILLSLVKVDTKYTGAYSTFSYILSDKLKLQPDLIMHFLETWIMYNKDRPKHINLFNDLFNELYRNQYPKFQVLLTNWLNSNNHYFHKAIFEIMRDFKLKDVDELSLSNNIIKKLSTRDIKYIVSKILGFIYDKDLSKTLLYSILKIRIKDDETVRLISLIYKDYLIFNYYSVIDYLEGKKKTATREEKKVINSIIFKSKKYYDNTYNLPLRNEFSPSEDRLKYFNKIQSKVFSKSFEEDEKKSNSFLSMMTTINFKTGKSMFAKFQGEYSDKMTPALISHSTEMPRGEFIDPIGQSKSRLIWQNTKR